MQTASVSRIAITSEGPRSEDAVDPRFGRAAGFVVVDLDSMTMSYLDNGSSQVLAQGAGIQAAENLVKADVQALLTGHVGPKAWAALQAAGIKVVQGVEHQTVGEAIERFKTGAFQYSDAPTR